MPVVCKMTEKLWANIDFFPCQQKKSQGFVCGHFFFCNRVTAGNAATSVADTVHVEKNVYGK